MLSRMKGRLSGGLGGGLLIAGSTLIAQVAGLAALPVISRTYSPADLGLLSVVMAITLILGTVSTGRFELAIPLVTSQEGVRSLCRLALLLSGIVSLLSVVVLSLLGWVGYLDESQPTRSWWLFAVPVCGLLFAAYLTFNQVAIRDRQYGRVGARNIANGGGTAVAQSTFGLLGFQPGGLIVGYLVGLALGALAVRPRGLLRGRSACATDPESSMGRLLTRYRRFPLLMGPSALINIVGLQLPVLLVAVLYSADDAGWLGMTQRILAVPITLIGTAISQVYLAEIAGVVRSGAGHAYELFVRSSRLLGLTAAFSAAIVIFAGPQLFELALGAGWRESGRFAQALALAMAAQFVAAPLGQTLIALERQSVQLGWDVARLVATAVVILGCVWSGCSALTTMWAFGAVSALSYATLWLLSWRAVRSHDRSSRG